MNNTSPEVTESSLYMDEKYEVIFEFYIIDAFIFNSPAFVI